MFLTAMLFCKQNLHNHSCSQVSDSTFHFRQFFGSKKTRVFLVRHITHPIKWSNRREKNKIKEQKNLEKWGKILERFSGYAVCGFRGLCNMLFLMKGGIRNRLAAVCMDLLWLGGVCPEPWRSIWNNDMIGPYYWKRNNFNPPLLQE